MALCLSIKFLEENNASFIKEVLMEDVSFIISILLKAKRMMFLNKVGYKL